MKKRLGLMLIGCVLGLPLTGHAAQTCRSEAEIPSTTPTTRFTDQGNGTVTDTLTGLMWAQCLAGRSGAGCATGADSLHTWDAALTLADGSALAGYTDWRLPNVNELLSIVEQRCYDPAMNLAVFPNTPGWYMWSASPTAGNPNGTWQFSSLDGSADWNGARNNGFMVRLVRGGQ